MMLQYKESSLTFKQKILKLKCNMLNSHPVNIVSVSKLRLLVEKGQMYFDSQYMGPDVCAMNLPLAPQTVMDSYWI